ncbi:MAG: hypothetical protein DYH08_09475 [Actinobacteria bacterium ATB1]|nr:hypothetical protein [Actinobacteria bacterium ATB1]
MPSSSGSSRVVVDGVVEDDVVVVSGGGRSGFPHLHRVTTLGSSGGAVEVVDDSSGVSVTAGDGSTRTAVPSSSRERRA